MPKFLSTIANSLWRYRKAIGIRVAIVACLVAFEVIRSMSRILRDRC